MSIRGGVELWPCKGQRARAQGSVLYYHIVLYTLPERIVEGRLLEEMMGERGREVIIVNVLLDRYIYYCVTCDNNNCVVVMVA